MIHAENDEAREMKLEGILPALTTPFDDDAVSVAALRHNLERYGRLDLGGYLVLGSTAETVLLDENERRLVLETARASIPAGKTMVAGVSAESTREALVQARAAAECGADAVLVSTPHYYRAQVTSQALALHYTAVADGSRVPVLLYNVPKFTGVVIPDEVVFEVGAHGNVAGMKESSGDLGYLRRVLSGVAPGFRLLCGATSILRDALDAGAGGGILAAATVFPEPLIRIAVDSTTPDDVRRETLRASDLVASRHGIAGIKHAMDLRGLRGGAVRAPLPPLADAAAREIESALGGLVRCGALAQREI